MKCFCFLSERRFRATDTAIGGGEESENLHPSDVTLYSIKAIARAVSLPAHGAARASFTTSFVLIIKHHAASV
jgi:hypothetical protein